MEFQGIIDIDGKECIGVFKDDGEEIALVGYWEEVSEPCHS